MVNKDLHTNKDLDIGPTTWYLFQNNLREPDMQIDCFRRTLKTYLFDQYSAH